MMVMAAAASQTATLVVGQSNARGSGKDAPEAKSSHKALWIALGVLGAGGVAIGVELDAQECPGVALDERAAKAVERGALLGVVQDEAVHDFDG